jgi:hypothetical protein
LTGCRQGRTEAKKAFVAIGFITEKASHHFKKATKIVFKKPQIL